MLLFTDTYFDLLRKPTRTDVEHHFDLLCGFGPAPSVFLRPVEQVGEGVAANTVEARKDTGAVFAEISAAKVTGI